MKTLVIVAHPQLDASTAQSFLKTAALADSAVIWHELTAPFDIAAEQKLLHSVDRIIFQFPMYWYSAPAILKQWLDEVWNSQLTSNRLVKGRQLGIVVTVAHPATAFGPGASQEYTIAELLRPYQALAHATGMQYLPPLPIYQFAQQTEEEKQLLYIRYQQYLTLKISQREEKKACRAWHNPSQFPNIFFNFRFLRHPEFKRHVIIKSAEFALMMRAARRHLQQSRPSLVWRPPNCSRKMHKTSFCNTFAILLKMSCIFLHFLIR